MPADILMQKNRQQRGSMTVTTTNSSCRYNSNSNSNSNNDNCDGGCACTISSSRSIANSIMKGSHGTTSGTPKAALLSLMVLLAIISIDTAAAFTLKRPTNSVIVRSQQQRSHQKISFHARSIQPRAVSTDNRYHVSSSSPLQMANGGDEDTIKQEEARMKILTSRRETIRDYLKNAEVIKNFRINNGFVPQIDPETGKPIKSDSKLALTLTAFVIAAGAVTLRIGGRAALVSAVGLDFANENPELKENMDTFLNYASSLNPNLEGLLFILAWTFVKVFCFDFGGIILALSSGILFGGVIQGAVFSAFAATVGSSVAFFLAKADTPVRKKALDVVEEYPSLRGIEKVVAQDGLKAILTLRLAPVLPIPIGMYNYVYGVTNVPYFDFAGGVFLGSLKPYLLDSYLGYFGKQVVEGTAGQEGGIQDVILLVGLGVSVLIGVFASQLAGETWDSVTQEIEAEKKAKAEAEGTGDSDPDDGITRSLFGMDLPQWAVGMQLSLQAAEQQVQEMIDIEYENKVWNYTEEFPPPTYLDPAYFHDSPEIAGRGSGFDPVATICTGLVLSPCLFKSFLTYADPLYNDTARVTTTIGSDLNIGMSVDMTKTLDTSFNGAFNSTSSSSSTAPMISQSSTMNDETKESKSSPFFSSSTSTSKEEEQMLLQVLSQLRDKTEQNIIRIDKDLESL